MKKSYEVNFDGLVGPTHNYAGLSFGNLASEKHIGDVSRPKAAALQGLKKMQFMHKLGLKQAILPPLKRPFLNLPRALGFEGSDAEVLEAVSKKMPQLLPQIYSASNMWVANAATISPSADTQSGKLHFTPANLVTHLHRAIEAEETAFHLSKIFANSDHFQQHPPLPMQTAFGDEGAANIMRFSHTHGDAGLEVLVYGAKTKKFPSRQTKLANDALFMRHGVKNSLSLEQNPEAIDAGVFHNDVIAIANENVLLYHELAFAKGEKDVDAIESAFGETLIRVNVKSTDVSLSEAVKTYLFNSQLVTLPKGGMAIIAPTESEESPAVSRILASIVKAKDNPISAVHYLDLRESMKNGGGPACLRLRVVLTEEELAAIHQGVLYSPALHTKLEQWINTHYRETLSPADLHNSTLMEESFTSHAALMEIIGF